MIEVCLKDDSKDHDSSYTLLSQMAPLQQVCANTNTVHNPHHLTVSRFWPSMFVCWDSFAPHVYCDTWEWSCYSQQNKKANWIKYVISCFIAMTSTDFFFLFVFFWHRSLWRTTLKSTNLLQAQTNGTLGIQGTPVAKVILCTTQKRPLQLLQSKA